LCEGAARSVARYLVEKQSAAGLYSENINFSLPSLELGGAEALGSFSLLHRSWQSSGRQLLEHVNDGPLGATQNRTAPRKRSADADTRYSKRACLSLVRTSLSGRSSSTSPYAALTSDLSPSASECGTPSSSQSLLASGCATTFSNQSPFTSQRGTLFSDQHSSTFQCGTSPSVDIDSAKIFSQSPLAQHSSEARESTIGRSSYFTSPCRSVSLLDKSPPQIYYIPGQPGANSICPNVGERDGDMSPEGHSRQDLESSRLNVLSTLATNLAETYESPDKTQDFARQRAYERQAYLQPEDLSFTARELNESSQAQELLDNWEAQFQTDIDSFMDDLIPDFHSL
jgi:hypothetical protein